MDGLAAIALASQVPCMPVVPVDYVEANMSCIVTSVFMCYR